MSVQVQGGMWCERCGRPVAGQRSTSHVRNTSALLAAPLTGGLSLAGLKPQEGWLCPFCGGPARDAMDSELSQEPLNEVAVSPPEELPERQPLPVEIYGGATCPGCLRKATLWPNRSVSSCEYCGSVLEKDQSAGGWLSAFEDPTAMAINDGQGLLDELERRSILSRLKGEIVEGESIVAAVIARSEADPEGTVLALTKNDLAIASPEETKWQSFKSLASPTALKVAREPGSNTYMISIRADSMDTRFAVTGRPAGEFAARLSRGRQDVVEHQIMERYKEAAEMRRAHSGKRKKSRDKR